MKSIASKVTLTAAILIATGICFANEGQSSPEQLNEKQLNAKKLSEESAHAERAYQFYASLDPKNIEFQVTEERSGMASEFAGAKISTLLSAVPKYELEMTARGIQVSTSTPNRKAIDAILTRNLPTLSEKEETYEVMRYRLLRIDYKLAGTQLSHQAIEFCGRLSCEVFDPVIPTLETFYSESRQVNQDIVTKFGPINKLPNGYACVLPGNYNSSSVTRSKAARQVKLGHLWTTLTLWLGDVSVSGACRLPKLGSDGNYSCAMPQPSVNAIGADYELGFLSYYSADCTKHTAIHQRSPIVSALAGSGCGYKDGVGADFSMTSEHVGNGNFNFKFDLGQGTSHVSNLIDSIWDRCVLRIVN